MKITKQNYEEIKKSMREFLIAEIEKYIKKAGDKKRLSLMLNHEDSYVWKKYKRALLGSISGLDKLYRECLEKIGDLKEN